MVFDMLARRAMTGFATVLIEAELIAKRFAVGGDVEIGRLVGVALGAHLAADELRWVGGGLILADTRLGQGGFALLPILFLSFIVRRGGTDRQNGRKNTERNAQ